MSKSTHRLLSLLTDAELERVAAEGLSAWKTILAERLRFADCEPVPADRLGYEARVCRCWAPIWVKGDHVSDWFAFRPHVCHGPVTAEDRTRWAAQRRQERQTGRQRLRETRPVRRHGI